MGYDVQGLANIRQGIMSPIVPTPWIKHERLGFDGIMENPITINTTFLKAKDMLELDFSSREEELLVSEVVNPLPPQPSCDRLKEGSDEKIS